METWTPEIVLEHLKAIMASNDLRYQERFDAQEKAIAAALNSQEKAVRMAEINSEKWWANANEWRVNANEWRAAMTAREMNFVSSAEVKLIKERMDRHEGEGTGMKNLWGFIVAGIAIIITVITFMSKPPANNNEAVDSQQIQQNGNNTLANGKKSDDIKVQLQHLQDILDKTTK